jgi:citrate lyase beta subunit
MIDIPVVERAKRLLARAEQARAKQSRTAAAS